MSSVALSGNASGAGVFTIASPNSASSYTLTLPTTTGTLIAGVATEAQGGTGTTVGYNGFKNRIINGAMVIDQRNAGASVSGTSAVYTLDRWTVQNNSGAARFNVQQNAGSVTPPAGYTYYLGVTSTSAYTVASTDVIGIQQFIEGYNIADLAWGTASASPVAFSFWVRSSLTGTFGGSLIEANAGTAFYPFTYTISAANTWEQKTVTIAGPTIGTWNSTNARGIQVLFNLGTGATYIGAAGSWTANSYYAATGATNFVATNGATFYITGVQLEKGSTATSFDYRPYGTELQLCQRYYVRYTGNGYVGPIGIIASSTSAYIGIPISMRATPTPSYSNAFLNDISGNPSITSISASASSINIVTLTVNATGGGLTAGRAAIIYANSGYIDLSAEL